VTRLTAVLALALLAAAPTPAAGADPWTKLHRVLHLPSVAPGSTCPVSRVDTRVDWKRARIFGGTGIGQGPVYAGLGASKGHVRATPDEQFGGPWAGQKVFWYVAPAYRGPVLIRGARVDGPETLGFNGTATPEPELRIEPGETVSWDGKPRRSRGVPSGVRARTSGCYAVQIDGTSFSRVVVFSVVVAQR
jgi:hypothetical protein